MSEPRRRLPLLRLAARNTRRNTRRTLLTMTAVMVAVATVTFAFGYINGIMDDFLDSWARVQSGHVRITHSEFSARERFLPMHLNVPHISELLPVIRSHPAVVEAVPRIRTAVLADNGNDNTPAILIGADLEREIGYLDILAMVSEGRAPEVGETGMLIGYMLAEQLAVSVGDTLTLLGQTAYRSLGGIRARITGLTSTGIDPLDRMTIFMPLDQAQYMTDLDDSTTEILVFIEDVELAGAVAESLHEELDPLVIGGVEVVSWMDASQFMQLLNMADVIYGAIMFIFLLMAGLIIVNTMLMTVLERTQEFGMLGAMGMNNRSIVLLIIGEGLIIGLIGATIGGLVGSGFAIWLENTGLNMAKAVEGMDWPISGILYPDWNLSHLIIGIAMGVLTAGIATLLPARRVIRMKPAEALRE